MRKLRDFKCKDCETITEKLVNDDVEVVMCPECCGNAEKQLSAPAGSGNAAHGFMGKATTNNKALSNFIETSSNIGDESLQRGQILGSTKEVI